MGKVLQAPPPKLEGLVSPVIARVIEKCLAKDPDNRWDSARDLQTYLGWAFTEKEPEPKTGKNTPVLRAARAGLALLALVALGLWFLFPGRKAAPVEPLVLPIQLPQNGQVLASATVSLSPDGKRIAFPGSAPDGTHVYVQELDGSAARVVSGARVTLVTPPFFWSPDSKRLVYSSVGPTVNVLDVDSGAIRVLAPKPGTAVVGGAWNHEDTVILGAAATGLWRFSARMPAAPVVLTQLDKTRHETSHQMPMFLPDERHFLYFAASSDKSLSGIFARSLDDPADKPSSLVVSTEFTARFVPGPGAGSGRLLYMLNGNLVSQALDTGRLRLTGDAVRIPVRVGTAYQTALFSASPRILVYRGEGAREDRQIVRVDGKTGSDLEAAGEPDGIEDDARLSPDGKRVVYVRNADNAHRDIWILDLERKTRSRLTFGGDHRTPVWTPDGKDITYSKRGDKMQIFNKSADGSGPEVPLLTLEGQTWASPRDWSHDGRFLLLDRYRYHHNGDPFLDLVWFSRATGLVAPFSASPEFPEGHSRFSPNGNYIAYEATEPAAPQIYVSAFGPAGVPEGKWLVSQQGGILPEWSRDGKTLYWIFGGSAWSASVDTTHGFRSSTPQKLYPLNGADSVVSVMTEKGEGLLLRRAGTNGRDPIRVLIDWSPGE
jgi:Tol biopolymer transport system component